MLTYDSKVTNSQDIGGDFRTHRIKTRAVHQALYQHHTCYSWILAALGEKKFMTLAKGSHKCQFADSIPYHA